MKAFLIVTAFYHALVTVDSIVEISEGKGGWSKPVGLLVNGGLVFWAATLLYLNYGALR